MASADISELWHLAYWYPSNEHAGEDVSEYDVTVHNAGKALIFESTTTTDRSYIFARLTDEGDDLFTGTWYETTSPTGAFHGAQYSGAGQLLMNEAGSKLDGMWAGAGFNHETKQMDVYSGKWVIERKG